MKNKKNVLALVPLLTIAGLAGCSLFGKPSGEEGDEPTDLSKTQLKVAAVSSGVEEGWLRDLAGRFTEKYKDYVFEPGKKGIQISIHGGKDEYNGDKLSQTISTDDHQIYYIENAKYSTFKEKVLNLKELVNIKGSDGNQFYTDSESILERMDSQFKNAFVKGDDVYMLPYYESFASFQYDKDVFNSPKRTSGKSFYFKKSTLVSGASASYTDSSNPSPVKDSYNVNNPQANLGVFFCDTNEDASHRSLGPDGLPGTFDDGLPQTFKEFEILAKVMSNASYTPILGNSTYNYYFSDMLASMWANEEGFDNMNLNFNWNGTANDLLKIENNQIKKNGDGSFVYDSPTTISKANAYELHRQEGVYRALEFSSLLSKLNSDISPAFTDSQSLLADTQYRPSSDLCYGLLVDGNWWENEAKNTIYSNASRLQRHFGFFNLPKSSAAKWTATKGEVTYYNINSSVCFINKNTPSNLLEAAKAFFLFTNSVEGMSAFTTSTSITRPFKYELTSSDSQKISSYGKDMITLRSYFDNPSSNYNIVSSYPLSSVVEDNEDMVHKYNWNFQTDLEANLKDKAMPFNTMKAKGTSPEQYFVTSYNYTKGQYKPQ